jgi:hypothetical protein
MLREQHFSSVVDKVGDIDEELYEEGLLLHTLPLTKLHFQLHSFYFYFIFTFKYLLNFSKLNSSISTFAYIYSQFNFFINLTLTSNLFYINTYFISYNSNNFFKIISKIIYNLTFTFMCMNKSIYFNM